MNFDKKLRKLTFISEQTQIQRIQGSPISRCWATEQSEAKHCRCVRLILRQTHATPERSDETRVTPMVKFPCVSRF